MRALLCLVVVGCTTHQSGLVPRPRTPLGYDGQPLAAPVVIAAHGETTAVAAQPTNDRANGSVVARNHLGATARFRVREELELAVTFEAALGGGAVSAGPGDPADFAHAMAWGPGLALRYSAEMSPGSGWRLGLSADLSFWHIPLAIGSDTDASLGLTIMPSYRTGPVVIFGGGTLATQISVPAIDQNTGIDSPTKISFVPIGHGGVEVEVASGVTLAATVAITYGAQARDVPLVGVTLGIAPALLGR